MDHLILKDWDGRLAGHMGPCAPGVDKVCSMSPRFVPGTDGGNVLLLRHMISNLL